MGKKQPYNFISKKREDGSYFAVRATASSSMLNFWYVSIAHTYLYTFVKTEKYNNRTEWTEKQCQELLDALRSEKPTLRVIRFAVDNMLVFDDEKLGDVPATPYSNGPETRFIVVAASKKRREIEKDKGSRPAPYVLFGILQDNIGGKEYAWNLTQDKPRRQNIMPGDLVLVWTRSGFKKAITTRIVKSEETEVKPTCRVKMVLNKDSQKGD